MLREILERGHVSFHEQFPDWESAVRASYVPMLEDHTVTEGYVDAVVNTVHQFGAYIVFAPNIALPHTAAGTPGVSRTAMGLMCVRKPVRFEAGNPDSDARLFFPVAVSDPDAHLESMKQLAELLSEQEVVNRLLAVRCREDLEQLLVELEAH